jgi:hypothetical protein
MRDGMSADKTDGLIAERDHWIRLFNRLEASITHHRKGKLFGFDTSDEVDEALWHARDQVLKDAHKGHNDFQEEEQSPGAQDSGVGVRQRSSG